MLFHKQIISLYVQEQEALSRSAAITSRAAPPPVLPGKLKPPRLHHVLLRPRLLEMVTDSGALNLVNICAGAGFGKTTLMAQLAESLPGKSVWYQVDSLDSDPVIFLKHLIAGVASACEGVGSRALARLEDSGDISREGQNVLGVLLDELEENLQSPLVLCFDDYDLFDSVVFATSFFKYLVQNLPLQVVVMITSRTNLGLATRHLRSRGLVCEIGEEDLKFSLDELRELLRDAWDIDVSTATMQHLHKSTEGWAAGLVLLEEHLKSGSDFPELFSRKRIRRNVYEFLAEEVLNRQPEELQCFLVQSSLIELVDPDICDAVLAIDNSARLLVEAEKQYLFTTRAGDTDFFRYHPLFREFLRARLVENFGKEKIKAIQKKYGKAFEAAGDKEKAIEQYLAADSRDDAIRLIEETGDTMLKEGEYSTLGRWLDGLKGSDVPPALEVYRGRMLIAAGKDEKALTVLNNAKLFINSNDTEIMSRCSLASAEGLCGLGRAKEAVKELESLLSLPLSPPIKMEVLYKLGICTWNAYDDGSFQKYIGKTKSLAKKIKSISFLQRVEGLLALRYLSMGDFKRAYEVLTKLIMADSMNDERVYLQALNNLASASLLIANYKSALPHIERCFEMTKLRHEDSFLPVVLDNHGCLLIAIGDWEQGKDYLNQSIDLVSKSGATLEGGRTHCHLGTAERRAGNYAKAFDEHKESLSVARSVNDFYSEAVSTINIGADLLRIGNFSEADVYFTKADKFIYEYNFYYVLTHVDFHRAWAAHLAEDIKNEIKYLTSALKRANEYQHNHFIIQEGKISLPLFTTALANNIETDYVFWVLEQIGEPSLSSLEPLFDSDNSPIRTRAAMLIGRIGGASALALLRRLLKDDDVQVRQAARSAIKELRPRLRTPNEILTRRELQVLGLLADGLSNANIGARLFISERTVKAHVGKIFRKLGLTNRIEAALYYQQLEKEKNHTFSA